MNDYASPISRICAYIIDLVIIYIVLYLLTTTIPVLDKPIPYNIPDYNWGDPVTLTGAIKFLMFPRIWGQLLGIIISFFYFPICHSLLSWQATLGMKVMKIYICSTSYDRISFPRAFLRYFISRFNIIFLWIGWLMIFVTPRKQGLHDLISRTVVLNGEYPGSGYTNQPHEASSSYVKPSTENYINVPTEKYTPPAPKKDNSLEYYPPDKDE